jgi:YVTN family beta-propeller protein
MMAIGSSFGRWTTDIVVGCAALAVSVVSAPASAEQFFHFESPHVHPLELTPDGSRLLAVNTVDARLEVFDVLGKAPFLRHAGSISVGIEPVSVRVRNATEAWVVNHVSDSISVVDLATMRVKATVLTGDEPCDVVFAGSPQRAFVSISQMNRIEVLDPSDLAATRTSIAIAGEDPRALATDGVRVYAAIFDCGNDTTIIPHSVVSSEVNPYPGDPNPPPNYGDTFWPPLNPALPAAPRTGIIVRKNAAGQWLDDNGADWSAAVTWNLHGNDIAVIDANTFGTTYAKGFMTTPMAMDIAADGRLVVVGTEARNEIRFEPNLQGTFIEVQGALLAPGATTPATVADLNPHITYATPTVPMLQRMLSVGDPRGVAVSADGTRAYAAGMGSSNVVAFSLPGFARIGLSTVGEGPTGLALDAPRARLYTLNRFAGSISIVDETALAPLGEVEFFDPTPTVVRNGRPILFDTHISSGLGQASCASCHIDARMDQLVWDLGDPSGSMQQFDVACNPGLGGGSCGNWHPMKGPMATQTLIGLAGSEPFHWRGDRSTFSQFAHAAVALMGTESDFSPTEMARMEAYLATISHPPNPNRRLDGSFLPQLEGGNPATGEQLFFTGNLDFVQCGTCHSAANGAGPGVMSAGTINMPQGMKTPQLRNMLEKTGFDKTSQSNNRGFGYMHDGEFGTLFSLLKRPGFSFASGATGDQQRRDVVAFMLSWDTGTHASIGAQASMGGLAPTGAARRDELVAIASAGKAELVAKATVDGVERGFLRTAEGWQSDVAAESWTTADLDALAGPDAAVTYTLVPIGAGARWLDRDGDGVRDGDERANCGNPSDPSVAPNVLCRADLTGDGSVDASDLAILFNDWFESGPGDLNCDGIVYADDLTTLLNSWGACP